MSTATRSATAPASTPAATAAPSAARTSTSVPPPAGGAKVYSHREILEVMTGLLAALFTAMLSTTIVSTALPTIMSDLHGTQRQYTWVITASLLALTITTPIWGKLSDLFSKKLLVQMAIVVFVAGSVGAGLSQTVPPMMAFRALQGVGMGGLIAVTQAIMGSMISPRERGRYSGYMGAVMAVSTVSGPLLGGVLTDSVGWRWCFFVCVPLAMISLVVLQRTLKLVTIKRHVTIDYAGAALVAVVAALPMLWVTFAGSDYAWISWQSGAFLLGFLAAVALLVVVELRASEPMVPLRVLNNRTTLLMILASLGVGMAMFGSSTFLTQFFQLGGGHTPTRAGLMTIPLIVSQLLVSTLGGQLVSRTGRWKPLMLVGGVALVAGLGLMGTIDHTTPYWQVALYMVVMGVGIGALVQNIVLAVQNTVDVSQIGATSAAIAFFRSLAGAVGVAVLGAILANQVTDKVAAGLRTLGVSGAGAGDGSLDLDDLPAPVQAVVRAAYGDSFGELFLIAAAAAVLTLVTVLIVKEVPLRTTVEMRPEAAGDVSAALAEDTGREDRGLEGPKTAQIASDRVAAERLVETGSDDEQGTWDDPDARRVVAALDVLTAAQDQARSHQATSTRTQAELVGLVDALEQRIDQVAGEFRGQIDQIRARIAEPEAQPSLGADGEGGDGVRAYEYRLLLDSQQTADKVTRLARAEAERVLADAEQQVAELQGRIAWLKQAEAELADRVAERVRAEG
ncbi:drug resistance transporter, EmrB/QacA subfamily [Microlunatus sagamiharensis]|uniref:Drug resistance transporter, EmrB/QacA subfamily n=1 Tax=Microlunatus sagamiharensis TaxID=546874 RepID=A0A1H2M6Q6_9ACTN|nr:MFS transporter [Microlunatus sagamiharensis]SDU88804.1 drug resistance transporter, EmrB/QacA subfamily [Microlunatus sagamiharensis]